MSLFGSSSGKQPSIIPRISVFLRRQTHLYNIHPFPILNSETHSQASNKSNTSFFHRSHGGRPRVYPRVYPDRRTSREAQGTLPTPTLPSSKAQRPLTSCCNNVQPCCVCKPEKAARDDCMLFSKTEDPTQECKSTIDQYKSCMAGFGFKV